MLESFGFNGKMFLAVLRTLKKTTIMNIVLMAHLTLIFDLWRMNWPSRYEDSDMNMSRFHYGCDVFHWPQQQLLSAAGTNGLCFYILRFSQLLL